MFPSCEQYNEKGPAGVNLLTPDSLMTQRASDQSIPIPAMRRNLPSIQPIPSDARSQWGRIVPARQNSKIMQSALEAGASRRTPYLSRRAGRSVLAARVGGRLEVAVRRRHDETGECDGRNKVPKMWGQPDLPRRLFRAPEKLVLP